MSRRSVPAPPSSRSIEANLSWLAGGTSLAFAGGWAAYVLALLFNIAVARRLDPSSFGAFTLALTIVLILDNLAPFGMDQTVVRYVAMYRGQGQPRRVRGVVRLGVGVTLLLGLVLASALFILAAPVARLFHAKELAGILRALAFSIPIGATADLILGSVQAHTRVTPTILVRSFATPALRILAALVALTFAHTAVSVGIAYTLAECAALGMAVVAARRVLPGAEVGRPIRPPPEVIRFAWPLGINRLVSSVYNKTEVLFLGGLQTVGSVALFAAARRFTGVAGSVFNAFSMLFTPMASDLYAAKQPEQLATLYKTASRWVFSIGMPIFLVQALFGRWLLSAFGSHFKTANLALIILACGQLLNYATGTAGNMLINIGRSRLALANSAGALALSVVLDLLLITRYGLIGAAIANSVAVAALQIARVVEVYWITRMHPYSPTFLKPLGAGAAAALITNWAVRATPGGHLGALVSVVAMLAAYLAALVVLGFDEHDRMLVRRAVQRIRRSRRKVGSGAGGPDEGIDPSQEA